VKGGDGKAGRACVGCGEPIDGTGTACVKCGLELSLKIAKTPNVVDAAQTMERVLMVGDLARLQPQERVDYYMRTCESLGLNPLTKPFEFIHLNGQLRMYATKGCAEQLRNLHNIAITISSKERIDDVWVVVACASQPNGRADEDIGAVPIKGLNGERLANALMKAITKAKRRVTLSMCGLNMLDESELETVQGASHVSMDIKTGELDAEPMTAQLIESSAVAEEQAGERLRGDRWVDEAMRDIDRITAPYHLELWCYMNGAEARALESRARGKLWRRLAVNKDNTALRLNVSADAVQQWLREAPDNPVLDHFEPEHEPSPPHNHETGEVIEQPNTGPENTVLAFGKHAGTNLGSVPANYLRWLIPQLQDEINDPAKAKYQTNNAELLNDVRAVLDGHDHAFSGKE
jgi:hypothetical protein